MTSTMFSSRSTKKSFRSLLWMREVPWSTNARDNTLKWLSTALYLAGDSRLLRSAGTRGWGRGRGQVPCATCVCEQRLLTLHDSLLSPLHPGLVDEPQLEVVQLLEEVPVQLKVVVSGPRTRPCQTTPTGEVV